MTETEKEQDWQTYRSLLNDNIAIFTANLALFTAYPNPQLSSVVQFSLPYQRDESGLPATDEYQTLIGKIFKVLTQLSALPNTLFAGHIISDGMARLYFYTRDSNAFQAILAQFEEVDNVEVQLDRDWDLYFDFLLPSPLEMKINATEEVIEMLTQNNRLLSDTYLVEHSFHFDQKEKMQAFIEKMGLSDIPFNQIQYTDQPMRLDDEDDEVYILKLEQELTLDNSDIFIYVEFFEYLAKEFSGEYQGWECDNLVEDAQLN